MNAATGASGTLAKGTAAKKIAADAATTADASQRSRRSAGSVDRKNARSSVSSRAIPLPLRGPLCRQGATSEKRAHLVCRHRTRKVETLCFSAAVGLEEFGLLRRFHTFGGNVQRQLLRDHDDCAHDRRIVRSEERRV